MKRFKRFLTAPLRYRTSHGFGVHSPFAYSFITSVMIQNCHYYSYIDQNRRHNKVASEYRHKTNPVRYQHLVFRVVNYFSPSVIIAAGYGSGLEIMAALDVSCHSKVIQTGSGTPSQLYCSVTAEAADRIVKTESLSEALEYLKEDETPVVIVNEATGSDTAEFVINLLNDGGVAIFTNLNDSVELWEEANNRLSTHGMTFSNNRRGVIVGLHHLPRQRFKLWL